MIRRPPRSTLFPSTPLFRSAVRATAHGATIGGGRAGTGPGRGDRSQHDDSAPVVAALPGGGRGGARRSLEPAASLPARAAPPSAAPDPAAAPVGLELAADCAGSPAAAAHGRPRAAPPGAGADPPARPAPRAAL